MVISAAFLLWIKSHSSLKSCTDLMYRKATNRNPYSTISISGINEICRETIFTALSATTVNKKVFIRTGAYFLQLYFAFSALPIRTEADSDSISLQTQLESFQEDIESSNLRIAREPKNLIKNIKSKLRAPAVGSQANQKEIDDSILRVTTLKAYLDEAERDLFSRNWENLQIYLYTFAEQENAFATLIQQLFPNNDDLDKSAREALSFEAKSMFLSLDELREAAKDRAFKPAQSAYAKLLLSYDRFLKAGGLYPTYDPITSTAIFFKGTPLETLKFDVKSKVQVLDQVVLISGPDMGKNKITISALN